MDWEKTQRQVREKYPDVRRVSPETLVEWFERDGPTAVRCLDVRAKEEFDVSHIEGARSWPAGTQPASALDGLDRADRIVAYCSVGYRSSEAVRRLQAMGYTHAFRLDGDFFGWVNAGRPVVRDGKRTDDVHTYSRKWGTLLDRENERPERG